MTRRRDYKRSLQLPGYIAFTHQVNKVFIKHKKMFLWLAVIYAVLSAALVGIGSQETYTTLSDSLRSAATEVVGGNTAQIWQVGIVLGTLATSGLSQTPSEGQQIFGALLILLVWLTTVWLLRNVLAGHKVRLRDGLYSAGAPIVPTFIITLVMLVQLIPVAIAAIGFTAASSTGLLSSGVEAMLFWFAAGALALLSLYWLTSTFFAMIIVTLPGTYPVRALRMAGDMVVGRRIRILLRVIWMLVPLALAWIIVMLPVVLIDSWIKGIWAWSAWIPIVPVFLMLMGVLSVTWTAGYIYLLYRKVVEDDAKPA